MRTTRLITQSETVDLTQAGTIDIANVSGAAPIYVLTDEEQADVDQIEDFNLRNNVMNSMYRIQAGQRRTLPKAKYQVVLGINAKAFLAYNGPVRINNVPSN